MRDPAAHISVLSHDISGQERSSVSVTPDHAIIIPSVNEELEPQSLKLSQRQQISPDVSGIILEPVTQIEAHKLLCIA